MGDSIQQDLRCALRGLSRAPGFACSVVLTLGLAIGANASIFAVVERVLLNPLPYPDSDHVVTLDHGAPGLNIPSGIGMTSGLYYHYLEHARTLDGVALYRTDELTLTGRGDPERIRVSRATPSLASVLRVTPEQGRWFTNEEGVPGVAQVAILAHGLWVRRYGGSPDILGQSVTLNGVPTTVVGVMPPTFGFPDADVQLWVAALSTRASASLSSGFDFSGIARLRDGATPEDARAELNRLIADLPHLYPNDQFASMIVSSIKLVSIATTLKEATVIGVARALWMLLASAGIVLLIACANVANLFLVRSEAQQRDIAVRRALGASRLGVAGPSIAESTLLSIGGGVIGVALAWGGLRLLVGVAPINLPRLQEVRLDGVVFAFTLVVAMVGALAFGAIPLAHGTSLATAVRGVGRGNTPSPRRHSIRHLLMGGQVALALVLLVVSGLMARSVQQLRIVDPGFNAASALTFSIGLPARAYTDLGAVVGAHRAILDRLSTLPGVTDVSASTCLPLEGTCSSNPLLVQGQARLEGTVAPLVTFRATAGGYFETMGTRLLRGRGIERQDVERNEPIAVVNQALVDTYFPGQDAIGARVTRQGLRDPVWLTIVGIASNTPVRTLGEAHQTPQLYMPIFSNRDLGPDVDVLRYVVRTATPPIDLLTSIRRAVNEVDPNLALAQVHTLQDTLDRATAQMTFTMVVLTIAAAVALFLGLIGIYGVVSYIVSQRTSEIGLRLALGAEPRAVATMIVRQGSAVAAAGIATGVAAALAGSRFIDSLLYGVSSRDPAIYATTVVTLFGVVLLACWLPARRAAHIDPIVALRQD